VDETPNRSTAGVDDSTDPARLLDSLPDPVVVVSPDGVLRWANDTAERAFGWTRAEFIGADATRLVHPDDLTTALVSLDSVQGKTAGSLVELRVRDHTGRYRRVEVRGRAATSVPGVEGVVLVLRDVTDRRRWDLAQGEDTAAGSVLEALPTIALVLTPDGRIESANRAFTRLLGHDLEDTLMRPLTDFVSVHRVLAVSDQMASVPGSGGRTTFEADLVDVDGTPHPMSVTVVDLCADDAVRGLVATATDISALAEVRDRLAHAATHDDLTGLPNRMFLHERLERTLTHAAFRQFGVGVLFVDVDEIRSINERFGHRAGDRVLIEVANRLGSAVRDTDLVARYGSDEFAVVAGGLDRQGTGRLVDRIHWLMQSPIEIDAATEVRVSLSVGAVVTEPGMAANDAVAAADRAMQRERDRRRDRTG
jgi:diguanylate cyclase (GGDEF)-like protein/PAS domain S-box-containing protein